MTRINPAMRIPEAQIDTLVARVDALKARPERWSFELRAIIHALNTIQPCDEFGALIDQLDDELGDGEPKFCVVRAFGEYFDADLVEVRSAWGLGR